MRVGIPCPGCGGCGTAHCCEGERPDLAPEIQRPWFEVLGVAESTPVAAYRALAKEVGNLLAGEGNGKLTELNLAIEQARRLHGE